MRSNYLHLSRLITTASSTQDITHDTVLSFPFPRVLVACWLISRVVPVRVAGDVFVVCLRPILSSSSAAEWRTYAAFVPRIVPRLRRPLDALPRVIYLVLCVIDGTNADEIVERRRCLSATDNRSGFPGRVTGILATEVWWAYTLIAVAGPTVWNSLQPDELKIRRVMSTASKHSSSKQSCPTFTSATSTLEVIF